MTTYKLNSDISIKNEIKSEYFNDSGVKVSITANHHGYTIITDDTVITLCANQSPKENFNAALKIANEMWC